MGSNKNKGFSLIELMVVVTLFGIAASVVGVKYSHYVKEKELYDTRMRSNLISAAFSRYVFNFGALPCPASPSLPPGSPRAGVGDCTTVLNQFPSPAKWQPNVSCDANNICVVQGTRFTANNPTYCPGPVACGGRRGNSAAYNDPVIIGTLPYVDLGLAVSDSVDGWGNRMTYAVSYYLTSDWVKPGLQCTSPTPTPHAFCPDFGVISQENYDAWADAVVPTPNPNLSIGPPGVTDSFMLAIISHGPDGKGAWTYSGARPIPCDLTPIDTGADSGLPRQPTSTGRDNENCNGDAVFLANGAGQQNLTSLSSGPNFYDDALVMTDVTIGSGTWRMNQQGNQMENMSGGFVGINTSVPAVPLDVQGSIQAANFQSDTYCDNNTKNCFQQTLLSPGLTCNNGPMTGIASSMPQCQTAIDLTVQGSGSESGEAQEPGQFPAPEPAVNPGACPSGQFMTGIDKKGNLQCSTP